MTRRAGTLRRRLMLALALFTGGVALVFGLFAVTALVGWLLHTLNERLEHRVPRYRRKLEDMYVSFHRFLEAVRSAARRGVRG